MPDQIAPFLAAVKWGLYVSALLAAGLGVHVALGIAGGGNRASTLRLAAILGIVATVLMAIRLLLLNAQMTGGLAAALDFSMFGWIWRANAWSAVALATGAGALIVGALWPRAPFIAAAGALAVTGSFALTGHTQALEEPGWAPAAVFAHATLGAFWLAAPVTLWPRRSLTAAEIVDRLERFSAIAIAAIPVLFVLGALIALRLAGSPQALFGTDYGQLIVAKLVAAALALGLGAVNKVILTQHVRAERPSAIAHLRLALVADAVLFALALAFVAAATTITGPEAAS